MRANLINGQLIPPTSLHEGRERLHLLQAEVDKIDRQIVDPARALSQPDYKGWRRRAASARALFRTELRLLEVWVAERETEAVDECLVTAPVEDGETDYESFWRE